MHAPTADTPETTLFKQLRPYAPLIAVMGFLVLASSLQQVIIGHFHAHIMMQTFMGGFFLLLGAAKLLDIRGFVDVFSQYDILGKRSRLYGFSFPFIEIVLGISYLSGAVGLSVLAITVLITSVSIIGVYRALKKDQQLTCACLGSVLDVPLTKVALIENVTMLTMAVLMLGLL